MSRYPHDTLIVFARELLLAQGMERKVATDVAEVLVEGDLLGKRTHGLQLLIPYLKGIESGSMTLAGVPETLKDLGAVVTLDGGYLPGPFVVRRAIEMAVCKARSFGVGVVSIRRSHHLAALQAYLRPVTDRGYAILLMCSDPSMASVAPHGGVTAVCTPNPIAAGFPTEGDPILIDTSAGSVTNGRSMQLHKRGQRYEHEHLQTSEGMATNDPAVLFGDPPGTILPVGGFALGHKGFGLAIMIEALSSGLCGYGRAERPDRWGASVYLQVMDPESFGGLEAFRRETTWFSESCRGAKSRDPGRRVRMPGEEALRLRREQLEGGVWIEPGIMESLGKWARRTGVEMPAGG